MPPLPLDLVLHTSDSKLDEQVSERKRTPPQPFPTLSVRFPLYQSVSRLHLCIVPTLNYERRRRRWSVAYLGSV